MERTYPTRIQQLLTPLRESITNKPPYIRGTLPLPASCFSLFYRTIEGGPNAMSDGPEFPGHQYDLYAENDDGPVSTKDQHASESILPLAHKRAFHDAFAALLENHEFLADGGTLAFGLAHAYSIGEDFKYLYGALKDSDAVVYRTLRALGFEPVLRMYYHEWKPDWVGDSLNGHAAVFDEIVDFSIWDWQERQDLFIPEFVRWNNGQFVRPEDLQSDEEFEYEENAEVVAWATPVTAFNRNESAFEIPNGKLAVTNVAAYGDLCLFARIGKAGERLSYPRVVRSKFV